MGQHGHPLPVSQHLPQWVFPKYNTRSTCHNVYRPFTVQVTCLNCKEKKQQQQKTCPNLSYLFKKKCFARFRSTWKWSVHNCNGAFLPLSRVMCSPPQARATWCVGTTRGDYGGTMSQTSPIPAHRAGRLSQLQRYWVSAALIPLHTITAGVRVQQLSLKDNSKLYIDTLVYLHNKYHHLAYQVRKLRVNLFWTRCATGCVFVYSDQ